MSIQRSPLEITVAMLERTDLVYVSHLSFFIAMLSSVTNMLVNYATKMLEMFIFTVDKTVKHK